MDDSDDMRAFLEFYKSMPELWDCKNEYYKNKNIRNKSYSKLLLEYKKVKSDATVEELKKKIANMRTCYRRELKKVTKSQKSGAGTDDIYVSNLWYYDIFDFLRDLEMPLSGRSTLSSDEDEENAVINVRKTQVSKKSSVANARVDFLKKATEHLESSSKIARVEDEAAVYANGWACMYRQMDPNQQLFAKRAIDEIIMMGRLNKLTIDTIQIFNENISGVSRASTPYSTTYYCDDAMQAVPAQVFSSGAQTYASVVSEQVKPNIAHNYANIAQLLTDHQYQ